PGNAPSPMSRPTGCPFWPRCPLAIDICRREDPQPEETSPRHTVRCWRAGEPIPAVTGTPLLSGHEDERSHILEIHGLNAGYGKLTVLEDIDLAVRPGDCVALLGESGSGKTTMAQCIAGLHAGYTGEMLLDGEPLAPGSFQRTREQRRRIQYIFQNPYESLNPRRTVRELILQPLRAVSGPISDPDAVVTQALEYASLRPDHASRYPSQLSGGERQRVAIARALATSPEIIVCDEITSALDVSVQSSLVELLRHLQSEMGLTLVFITHNIALVRNIAQQIAVLEAGHIVEFGPVEGVFANPQHEYTQSLIEATPNFQLTNVPGDSTDEDNGKGVPLG
ncbi:MAG: ATP-binding cassette domain-containing protein, partial [Micrococcales bacterium]|nr:ATP-binding cassette domain-containing protein [Micrococcales bacterium]